MNYYADIIVIRHPEWALRLAPPLSLKFRLLTPAMARDSIQRKALLDSYTIEREFGDADGIRIAFVGDLKYGRAARSLVYLLGKYKDVRVTFVSQPELCIGDDIKAYMKRHDMAFEETEAMEPAMKKADVVYQTRVQRSGSQAKKNICASGAACDKSITR